VVQYGLPSSRELYLHRLGRTARCGNQGRGLLVALPFEQVSHVVSVKKQSSSSRSSSSRNKCPPAGIARDEELTRLVETSQGDWCGDAAAVDVEDSSSGGRRRRSSIARKKDSPLEPAAAAAYSSFVAYYVEHAPRRGVSMPEIRQAAKALGRGALFLATLPELPTTLADKLGAGD
jgi:superfamily II DNA/RNA helicase